MIQVTDIEREVMKGNYTHAGYLLKQIWHELTDVVRDSLWDSIMEMYQAAQNDKQSNNVYSWVAKFKQSQLTHDQQVELARKVFGLEMK